jgi:hypothetical protein
VTKDNETGLKEGGGYRNVNYSAFHIRDCSLSFALKYLPETDIVKSEPRQLLPCVDGIVISSEQA